MEKKWCVVLVGDSLLIAGAATALANKPELDVFQTVQNADAFWKIWQLHQPDIILFDLEFPLSTPFFSLLIHQPGSLLVGLDLACRRAVVLNSQASPTTTMNNLYHLILTLANRLDVLFEGGSSIERNAETAVYPSH